MSNTAETLPLTIPHPGISPVGSDNSRSNPGPNPAAQWGDVPCRTVLTLMKVPTENKRAKNESQARLREFCFPLRSSSQSPSRFFSEPDRSPNLDRPRVVTQIKSPYQTKHELAEMEGHDSIWGEGTTDDDIRSSYSVSTQSPKRLGFHPVEDDVLLPFKSRETDVLTLIESDCNRRLKERLISNLGERAWVSVRDGILKIPRSELGDSAWLRRLKSSVWPVDPLLWISLSGLLGADQFDPPLFNIGGSENLNGGDAKEGGEGYRRSSMDWSIQPIRVKGPVKTSRSHSYSHGHRPWRSSLSSQPYNHRHSLQLSLSGSCVSTDSDQESCSVASLTSPKNFIMESIMEGDGNEENLPDLASGSCDVTMDGMAETGVDEQDVDDEAIHAGMIGLKIVDYPQPELAVSPGDECPAGEPMQGFCQSGLRYSFGSVHQPGLGLQHD